MYLTVLLLATTLSSSTHAWYKQVHNQIALASESFLTARTARLTSALLGARFNGSIGSGAGWADTIRPNSSSFSFNWHFVDMHEDLLGSAPSCPLSWEGVCGDENCVTAQITNQSRILSGCFRDLDTAQGSDARLGERASEYTAADCQRALLWVVHFIGDVAQPLHTSSTAEGGNGVKVRFNGTSTNLHSVWDQWIVYLAAGRIGVGFSADVIDDYFLSIRGKIINDAYQDSRESWAECLMRPDWRTACPKLWAEEAHMLVCDAVYSIQLEENTDVYLNGYATNMADVAELQMARAAWRTATWLNSLVDRMETDYVLPESFRLQI